jgi:hypothetical protein
MPNLIQSYDGQGFLSSLHDLIAAAVIRLVLRRDHAAYRRVAASDHRHCNGNGKVNYADDLIEPQDMS